MRDPICVPSASLSPTTLCDSQDVSCGELSGKRLISTQSHLSVDSAVGICDDEGDAALLDMEETYCEWKRN